MMMALRSFGLIPQMALNARAEAATMLTILAMAGLGLGVDAKTVTGVGPRVTAAVVLSLATLRVISVTLMRLIGVS